ncbi:hypothetical protein V1525DRAFT_411003 [Lipomyces kononenkoae]|uniref:Uncharacterized protein n=1 Tax=Lipomyces kononenkoae TaxID=34357 RepID=A0ACC3STW7_LIPKO
MNRSWRLLSNRTCLSRSFILCRLSPLQQIRPALPIRIETRRKLFTSRRPNHDDLFLYDYTKEYLSRRDSFVSRTRNPFYSYTGFLVRFVSTSALLSTGFLIVSELGYSYAGNVDYLRNLMASSPSPVTVTLVATNVALFVCKRALPGLTPFLVRHGYLRLDLLTRTREISSPVAPADSILLSAFSHRDGMHIFLNAYAMYNLGSFIEMIYGPHAILLLYAACGSAGSIGSLLLQRTHLPTLGASAVCMGMLSFLSTMRPDLEVSMLGLPFIRMTMETVTLGTAAWSVFGIARGFMGKRGGIDHAGHLGGLVGGWLVANWVQNMRTQVRDVKHRR